MRRVLAALAVGVAALCISPPAYARIYPAQPRVVIHVDKSQQRMVVVVNGTPSYSWDVSTGRDNFGTPTGTFAPQRLARSWFSSKYYNSPMPYSIFFHRGYAIHGSNEISKLGGPASHGCVRLHPQNAATLFSLVEQAGPGNTVIVVAGENPSPSMSRAYPRQPSFQPPSQPQWQQSERRDRYRDRPLPYPPSAYRGSRRGYVSADDGWRNWGR